MENKKLPAISTETSIQQTPSGLSNLKISERAKKIMTVMKQVNELLPASLPLTLPQLAQWSEDLNRLRPDVSSAQLLFLLDCFKTGAIEFNHNKGERNLFEGLNKIECVNGVWKIKEVWPG